MKKLTAILLSLILCFSLASTAFASNEESTEDLPDIEISETENGNLTELPLPENDDPELQKTIDILSTVATYIYNYATQPQEPAVDLETVLFIVSVVVTVIYTISQNA